MLACRLLGHRPDFRAEGPVMRWSCARGCGASGQKAYASEADAARYAQAFNRRDAHTLGRRAPLFGLFPLRLWYWLRRRRQRKAEARGAATATGADDTDGRPR